MEDRRFIFMADAHVKSRTWTNDTALSGDAYAALAKASVMIEGLGLPRKRLVIGGDWFDSNRVSSQDMLATAQFLSTFDEVGYIRGNHDSVSPAFLASLGTTSGVTPMITEMDATTFPAGIHWTPDTDSFREAFSASTADVIVLHTAFKHLLAREGMYQLTDDDVAALGHRTMVLVGHVHTPHMLKLENGSVILSPGSLYPTSIDKALSVPWYYVWLVDPDAMTATPVDVTVRRYTNFKWTNQQGLDEIADALVTDQPEHSDLKPLIVVEMPEGCGDVPRSETALLHVVRESHGADELAVDRTAELDSLNACIDEECGDDTDLAALVKTIVTSDDPLAEMDSWLKAWNADLLN